MHLIRKFQPDKSLNPQKQLLKFIRTENKYHAIWQYLKRYENKTYVKEKLKHDFSSLSSVKINQKSQHISDSIRQGESFFNAALDADLSVKPLIIYYGMLNLVKALIMFGENEFTLESPALKSHGLSHFAKANTQDASIRKDKNNLMDEFAYVSKRNSIFKLLHACWSQKDLNSDLRFHLLELTLMHPRSWKAVAEHMGKVPKLYVADGGFRTTKKKEHVITFSSITQFLIYQKPSQEKPEIFFERNFPLLTSLYTKNNFQSFSYISRNEPNTIDEFIPVYKSLNGDTYAITNVDSDLIISAIEVEFIIMFILGSIARYAPHKWLNNVRYEGNGEMFMLEGLINETLLSFPKMIMEELDAEESMFTGNISTWG